MVRICVTPCAIVRMCAGPCEMVYMYDVDVCSLFSNSLSISETVAVAFVARRGQAVRTEGRLTSCFQTLCSEPHGWAWWSGGPQVQGGQSGHENRECGQWEHVYLYYAYTIRSDKRISVCDHDYWGNWWKLNEKVGLRGTTGDSGRNDRIFEKSLCGNSTRKWGLLLIPPCDQTRDVWQRVASTVQEANVLIECADVLLFWILHETLNRTVGLCFLCCICKSSFLASHSYSFFILLVPPTTLHAAASFVCARFCFPSNFSKKTMRTKAQVQICESS